MRRGPAVLLVVACCGSCQRTSSAPPYKPIADVKLLMQAIDPQADIIWESVKTVITDKGTEDLSPKTAAEWTAVRNAAVLLAESGNLLMMPSRAQAGVEWMQAARALVDTSEAAMRAADARDRDRLFDIGGDINEACMRCHYHYDPNVKASRSKN